MLERFHFAIAAVTIVAATVFLLALTIMLVDERRETIGVLRLIGFPARRILLQVLVEGLVIASAGALFGLALALASEGLINRFFQWRYDTALLFVRVSPGVAATCLAIGVPLGALATVAASWALLRRGALRLRSTMTALRFAWRASSASRRARRSACSASPPSGALLFDMLLLSEGLVVSMRDLFERMGFDIRIIATDQLPAGEARHPGCLDGRGEDRGAADRAVRVDHPHRRRRLPNDAASANDGSIVGIGEGAPRPGPSCAGRSCGGPQKSCSTSMPRRR